jgi:hypothetical protein
MSNTQDTHPKKTSPASGLRLHVGCADKRLPEFINIDVRATSATDIIAHCWSIPGLQNESVALIYSRHLVEHLDPNDARRTLHHWFDLLQPDGVLHIIVPDIEFHAKQLLGLATSTLDDQRAHALAGFWGWRDESRGGNRTDAHRWGYTFKSLCDELKSAGFSHVERITEGCDSEPWHLNVCAMKRSGMH